MPNLNPAHLITTEADLRAAFKPTHENAKLKCIDRIDPHARAFIERSPFLCIGTQSSDGTADVSPRGDPKGFVKIVDEKTILIPDRPGNNRLDTLANIVSNPSVALIFLIPGFDETLRINGTAQLTRDPDLLKRLAVNDRTPTLAVAIKVDELFLHCAKAFRRSKLWDPNELQDRREMPSLMKIIMDQTERTPKDPDEMEKLDAGLEEAYRTSMY